MLLKDVFEKVKFRCKNFPGDLAITGIADDSRKVVPGNLFIAIPGTRVDGALFVTEAVKKGATAVVLEKEANVPDGTIKILVDNARLALAYLAANYFKHPSRPLPEALGDSAVSS